MACSVTRLLFTLSFVLPLTVALPYDRINYATITSPPQAKRTPTPFDFDFPGISLAPGINLLKGDLGLNAVETTVLGMSRVHQIFA